MFAIHRVEKCKKTAVFGLQIEANRTQADHEKGRNFDKSDIDWERTKLNQHFKGLHCGNWSEGISQELKKAGIEKAPKSNAVVLLDGLYTASPEWFEGKSKAEIIDFFKDCLKFHIQHYGKPLNAVIHWDEKSPHLAVASVPIIETEQGAKLCAKEIMGGRADYRARQDQFFEQVAKSRGFERGERSDPKHKKKHLSVQDYKKQQNEAQISAQERVLEKNRAEYQAIQKNLSESRLELDKAQEKLFAIEEKVQVKTSQWKELTKRINEALENQQNPLYDDYVKRFLQFMGDKLVTDGRKVMTLSEAFNQNYEKHLQKFGYEPIEQDDQELELDSFEWER